MDREALKKFLRKKGKKPPVVEKFLSMLDDYESFLKDHQNKTVIEESSVENLEAYVEWYEKTTKNKANTVLWGLFSIFEFISRDDLYKRASSLREERTKKTRAVFKLKDYVGINQEYIKRLADIKIKNIEDMIAAGKTRDLRKELAEKTGISTDEILKLVKLANLSRLGAVKKIRAPLYYEAGFDTLDKIANISPEEFISKVQEFIDRTNYDAIAPLPKEAVNTVNTAKKLPKIIEW